MKEVFHYSPYDEASADRAEILDNIDSVELLLRAYESAGEIKPLAELGSSIDRVQNPPVENEFMDMQADRSLAAVDIESGKRSRLNATIIEMVELRKSYPPDGEEERLLREYAKSRIQEPPRVFEYLRGLMIPYFGEKLSVTHLETTEAVQDLAVDVFWMIHREAEQAKKAVA